MRGSQDAYEHVVASLHEAAVGDADWAETERLISEAIGTEGSVLSLCKGTSTADFTRVSLTYNEALPDTRAPSGLHVRLDAPDGLHVVWGLCDSTDPDGWGSDQVQLIERLQPHVREFTVVRHTLAEAGIPGTSLNGLLASSRLASSISTGGDGS